MKIDGKAIADEIYTDLSSQVANLDVVPTLAVIQVGNNEASTAYINQKKIGARRIGARVIHELFPVTVSKNDLKNIIEHFNNDASVHGLIVQRPLALVELCQNVKKFKDIDGFLPDSPYTTPVASSVMTILTHIHNTYDKCVVIGRGETAGQPIAHMLKQQSWNVEIIHSKTSNPKDIIARSPVVISCVGKARVITKDMVNDHTVLIGVGLWQDNNGKLHGDYDEDEIKNTVAYYTPTPGGVGPVNVACLMQNLVLATKRSLI